ncbi:MAG: DUF3127 domain-containing protein [SAR324 cluster bacterium]|nr:DUF3127 domain-containing protein [SAR324 cluster bacterium]MBL7035119.1 DUF3127 domain-containing protein [SAR324 cluster bacterium]
MEIKGKIKKISETVQISDRFRKREFVVEYASNPDYPQALQFELVQDRCELLDSFEVGQEVEIFFDLRGREWTNPQGQVKYFNTLQAWKLVAEQSSAGVSAPNSTQATSVPPPQEKPGWLENETSDDLPF